MGDVDTAVGGGYFTEFYQFVCRGVEAWCVDEGGPDAQCAVFHGLFDEGLHFFQFCGSGGAIFVTQDIFPDGGGADEGGDVGGDAFLLEPVKVFFQGGPFDVVFYVALVAHVVFFHGVGEGAHGAALAEDFQGDALADGAHASAVLYQGGDGPGLHVYEAGADGFAGGVDVMLPGGGVGEVANEGDGVGVDTDVFLGGGVIGAIVEGTVTDDGVVLGFLMTGG